MSRFQSAPPAEARGDRFRRPLVRVDSGFNPLPPPKRGEMPEVFAGVTAPDCFNPLPPPKRGEIVGAAFLDLILRCFNPLPPPKRGEIRGVRRPGRGRGVSIRSPRRSEGRFHRI